MPLTPAIRTAFPHRLGLRFVLALLLERHGKIGVGDNDWLRDER